MINIFNESNQFADLITIPIRKQADDQSVKTFWYDAETDEQMRYITHLTYTDGVVVFYKTDSGSRFAHHIGTDKWLRGVESLVE